MSPAVEVKNLTKSFKVDFWAKAVQAVNGLTFDVQQNRIVGFLGANGAGKTTTIKTILGLIYPTSGEVRVFGKDPKNPESRREVGFLPERPYFYEYLTGREFLKFYGRLSNVLVTDEKIDELLQRVGVFHAADRPLRRFSKGMLQRVGLCQAIIHQPKLLILDEPMSGLDPDGRFDMLGLIRSIRDQGTTIFLSSHQLHDVESLCDDVVMIEKGRLVVQSEVKKLIEQESKGFLITFRTKEHSIAFFECSTEEELQKKIDEFRQHKTSIVAIEAKRPTLEEIFVRMKREFS